MNNQQRSSYPRRSAFSIQPSAFCLLHFPVLVEIALVFAVFFIQGFQPVPEVNEPYYLGKAIHYWNPDWAEGDFFLHTKDTHEVFYYTFGWLSLWLRPAGLAWFGRVLTWGLLAWAWRRLSFALLPKRWCSILTAALLVCLIERCNMAGEWVVGGVEAKGFAFVLVFLGLEALVRGRWNRTWLLLGAASAFHVLVGGWSVVAAGLAWLLLKSRRQKAGGSGQRAVGRGQDARSSPLAPDPTPPAPDPSPLIPPPSLRSMWPAILGGLLLALPGLVPALMLNWGTAAETLREANRIYVYRRLAHHLDPAQMPVLFIARFALLGVFWLLLCLCRPAEGTWRGLRAFVAAAVVIALLGGVICWLSLYAEDLGAALLRFYWFRLADVALPLGVALEGTSFALGRLRGRPAGAKRAMVIVVLVSSVHLGAHLLGFFAATPPRAYLMYEDRSPEEQMESFADWRDACAWISRPGHNAADARFLTPLTSGTFKWYAGRAEVANWKEIPQDAAAIVEWWQRIEQLRLGGRKGSDDESPADLGAERLQQLGLRYEAGYVITAAQPRLDLPVVYGNHTYVIYQLRTVAAPPDDTDN